MVNAPPSMLQRNVDCSLAPKEKLAEDELLSAGGELLIVALGGTVSILQL